MRWYNECLGAERVGGRADIGQPASSGRTEPDHDNIAIQSARPDRFDLWVSRPRRQWCGLFQSGHDGEGAQVAKGATLIPANSLVNGTSVTQDACDVVRDARPGWVQAPKKNCRRCFPNCDPTRRHTVLPRALLLSRSAVIAGPKQQSEARVRKRHGRSQGKISGTDRRSG